jgi:hypothetical protein
MPRGMNREELDRYITGNYGEDSIPRWEILDWDVCPQFDSINPCGCHVEGEGRNCPRHGVCIRATTN